MKSHINSRRRLLIGSASAVVVAGLSPSWATLAFSSPSSLKTQLIDLAGTDAVIVGRVALPALAEQDAWQLMAELRSRLAQFADRHGAVDRLELRALLQQAIRADFTEGRCVSVDGWVLAETEARLCALAALG